MPTKNPWLTPFQRSFNSIKDKLKTEMRAKLPEVTDMSEGNIFIILISQFSAIAEVLHYYIDNMARETFFTTARRYSSLYKHAKLVDYHIKSAYPSSVDLTIYRSGDQPVETSLTIPVDTLFTSNDGKQWVSYKTITWLRGTYSVKVPVVQKEPIGITGSINLGTITDQDVVIYLGDLPSDRKYVEGSMVLTIDGEPWTLVDTFAYSISTDKVYKVEVDEYGKPYITFGDGRFGQKPNLNGQVLGFWYITYGSLGNLPEASFTQVPNIISSVQNDAMVYNNFPASGGTDYEDFNMLKEHVPLSIKTLGVAITKEDYEAKAMLVPGVDKAYCNYICGRYVEIYITPDGGGEASQALIESTEQALAKSKVITTAIRVLAAHGAKVYVDVVVWGKKSFNREDISNQIKQALITRYNYNTSEVNQPVRLSDIYALIDNQTMVDYIKINKLYLLGYPAPVNSIRAQPELNITAFNQNRFNGVSELDSEVFNIVVINTTTYNIQLPDTSYVTGTFGTSLNVVTNKSNFDITIGNSTGNPYNAGDEYSLTIQAMNTDLIPRNFNQPIFEADTISLTINETV